MFSSETVNVQTINMVHPGPNPQGPDSELWQKIKEALAGFFKKPRRTDITTLRSAQRKLGTEITGHPGNNFECIFRIHKEGYFRALDAMQVEGGGIIIQSCWYENGRIAQDFRYEPDLALVEEEYLDEDGNKHIGKRIVRKESAWANY